MFSNRLQELRKSDCLSQAALAKELGVAQQTVAQWEGGTREPNIEMLIKIADFFAVSVDYLLDITSVSDFDRMLDEVDKVNKRDIKKFLDKLFLDTKNGKLQWKRYTDVFNAPEDPGIVNYDLSFVVNLAGIGGVCLIYCIDHNDYSGYTIMPEIHSQGESIVLPCDADTQRRVKRVHKLLERENPTRFMGKMSDFLQKYIQEK